MGLLGFGSLPEEEMIPLLFWNTLQALNVSFIKDIKEKKNKQKRW